MLAASHHKSGQEMQTSALGRWIDRHCKPILKDVWEKAVVTWEAQRLGLKKNTVNPINTAKTFLAAAQNATSDGRHSRLVRLW